MELTAVVEAFRRINERQLADRPITVYTSSNYINQGINTWLAGWKTNNWKGANKKTVKNAKLWQELDKWNEEFKPIWELITNEGDHPVDTDVKAMAVTAGKGA
jgi:ribonuclease HI